MQLSHADRAALRALVPYLNLDHGRGSDPREEYHQVGGYSDIVGYDEIVGALDEMDAATGNWLSVGDNLAIGDDIEQLLHAAGAEAAGAPSKIQQLAQKLSLARRIDPRAVTVMDRPATRRREYPLGFESAAEVALNGTALVRATPQISFRGERLVVPSDISLFFSIDDIIVGKNSQLVSDGPIPASTFSEVAVGVRLNLDTANIGNTITMRVRNVGSSDPIFFRASIIGTGVE
jgi:hypothetical protein